MLNRSNLYLIALLLAQLALLIVMAVSSSGAETRAVAPILQGMTAAEVTRLTIADEAGDILVFARADEGWVLPLADDFPVNGEKVDEMLSKIEQLDTRRLVASNPANFARLEVKEDDFRRQLTLEAGTARAELYLGASGGVDTVYTRRAGEDEVWLGFGLSSWELSTQAPTWVDTSYVNVPQDDLLEISVRNANGTFTFRRDGESWTYTDLPAGATFEDTKMPSILRNAATLRLMEPLGREMLPDYQLDAPQVSVDARYRALVESADAPEETAELADGADAAPPDYTEERYRIDFGAQREAGVVVKADTADYYILARDTVLSAFSSLKHEDFIRAPAEDEAATANP